MSFNYISSSSSSFTAAPVEPEKKGQSPTTEKAANIVVTALAAPEVQHEPKFIDMEVSQSEENEQSATTEKSNSVAVSTISQQEVQDDPMDVDLRQPEEQVPPFAVIDSGDPAVNELLMPDVENPELAPLPPLLVADCMLSSLHIVTFEGNHEAQVHAQVIDVEKLKPILGTLKNEFRHELSNLLVLDTELSALRLDPNLDNKKRNRISELEVYVVSTLKRTDIRAERMSFVPLGTTRIEEPLRCITWCTSAGAGGEIVVPHYFTCVLQGKMHVMMYNLKEGFQFQNGILKVVVDNFLVELPLDNVPADRPMGLIVVAIPFIEDGKLIGVNVTLYLDNTAYLNN